MKISNNNNNDKKDQERIKNFSVSIDNNLYEMRDITHNQNYICSDSRTISIDITTEDEKGTIKHYSKTTTKPHKLIMNKMPR